MFRSHSIFIGNEKNENQTAATLWRNKQCKGFFSLGSFVTFSRCLAREVTPQWLRVTHLERGLLWVVNVPASFLLCRRSDWSKCCRWTLNLVGGSPGDSRAPSVQSPPTCFFKEAAPLPCPVMESCKRNLICIRTSHTTTHLPFSSLAHNNRFFGFQSICFVPTAQGGGSEPAGHRRQKPEAFCQSACFPVQLSPVPASSSPIVPLPFMNGGGWCRGTDRRGSECCGSKEKR